MHDGRGDKHGRGSGIDEGLMHDGRGDRHGRWPGIDEGPCMMEAVTDMVEGQARERRQASVAWKAMDRFLDE